MFTSRLCSVAIAFFLIVCGTSAQAQVVAFGASNVSGWNVPAGDSFPSQLQEMLRAKGYYTLRIRNAGIYANTTTQMRERMDRDIPEGTTLVLLDMTGGYFNDYMKGISKEQGKADMDAIEARLKARAITVIPVDLTDIKGKYRQQDGRHLTSEGHKLAANQLLPQVIAALGPPEKMQPSVVQTACRADAKRLCGDVINNDVKRRACMHEHHAELSDDCIRAIYRSKRQAEESSR